MHAVILTIHSLIVLALIGIVLLQRSEGGALGMGGGGGGGFMTGRGTANLLTRTTSILAALFFSTSLGLAITAETGEDEDRVIEELTRGGEGAETAPVGPGSISTDDLLGTLGADEETPAAPAIEELAADPAEDPAAGLLDVDAPAEAVEEAADAVGETVDEAVSAVEDAVDEGAPQPQPQQ